MASAIQKIGPTRLSPHVLYALAHAKSPACRHRTNHDSGEVDGSRLVAALADATERDPYSLLKLTGLRPHDFRIKLGIIPRDKNEFVSPLHDAGNADLVTLDESGIRTDLFVAHLINNAGSSTTEGERIVGLDDLESTFLAQLYSHDTPNPPREIDELFAHSGLRTIEDVLRRAHKLDIPIKRVTFGDGRDRANVFPNNSARLNRNLARSY